MLAHTAKWVAQRRKLKLVTKDPERKQPRALRRAPKRWRRANRRENIFRPEPQPISPIHSRWSFGYNQGVPSTPNQHARPRRNKSAAVQLPSGLQHICPLPLTFLRPIKPVVFIQPAIQPSANSPLSACGSDLSLQAILRSLPEQPLSCSAQGWRGCQQESAPQQPPDGGRLVPLSSESISIQQVHSARRNYCLHSDSLP